MKIQISEVLVMRWALSVSVSSSVNAQDIKCVCGRISMAMGSKMSVSNQQKF